MPSSLNPNGLKAYWTAGQWDRCIEAQHLIHQVHQLWTLTLERQVTAFHFYHRPRWLLAASPPHPQPTTTNHKKSNSSSLKCLCECEKIVCYPPPQRPVSHVSTFCHSPSTAKTSSLHCRRCQTYKNESKYMLPHTSHLLSTPSSPRLHLLPNTGGKTWNVNIRCPAVPTSP